MAVQESIDMDFYTAILPIGNNGTNMNRKKRLLLILNIAMLFILSIVLVNMISRNKQKPENRIFPTMVHIFDGEYRGNGSILEKNKDEVILVTTKHLLENGDVTSVVFFDETEATGKVVYVSIEHDIGFVSVSREQLTKECFGQIDEVDYSEKKYKKLKQDDFMQYAYLKESGFCALEKGRIGNPYWYVETFSDYTLYNYCEAVPGMSGCGTFDKNGRYIGMLIGGYDNESACLPLGVVIDEYKKSL